MKKAVLTMAVGDAGRDLLNITGDGIAAYAARIGADYHVISGEPGRPEYPYDDKFRVAEYLDFYDRLIYIDADIVVADDAPDLFAAVPEENVGICNERLYGSRFGNMDREVGEFQAAYGFPRRRLRSYYNSGLMVLSRRHRPAVEPPTRPHPRAYHTAEQDLINARLLHHGFPVTEFGPEMCWMFFAEREGRTRAGRPFRHYAGASTLGRGHIVEMLGDPFADVWTPADRRLVYDVLRRLDAVLGDKYVLAKGALIGHVRQRDILQWDDDVDLLATDLPSAADLQAALDAQLPGLRAADSPTGVRVFDPTRPAVGDYTWPFVDVHRADVIPGTRRGRLGPVEINVPSNPRRVLEETYGPECIAEPVPPRWSNRHARPTGFPQRGFPLAAATNWKAPTVRWALKGNKKKEEAKKEKKPVFDKVGPRRTHMPFLHPQGGRDLLLLCQSDGKVSVTLGRGQRGMPTFSYEPWKLRWCLWGQQLTHRLTTGLPPDSVECSPAAFEENGELVVTFVAGVWAENRMSMSYHLYEMRGESPAKMGTPYKLIETPAFCGYRSPAHLVSNGKDDVIWVNGSPFVVDLPQIYRLSFLPDRPELVAVTGGTAARDDLRTVAFDPVSLRAWEVKGIGPVYKCAALADRLVSADIDGDGFEDRRLVWEEGWGLVTARNTVSRL